MKVKEYKAVHITVAGNGITNRGINYPLGTGSEETVSALNSIWWEEEKRMGQIMVETVFCCASKMWTIRENWRRCILTTKK